GDHRGRLAAGIRVAKKGKEGIWFELYVDKSDDAVVDLLKKYVKSDHAAKGSWKPDKTPNGQSCPESEDREKTDQ
ncbi:MAG: hypothetical protein H8E37_02045, partial [Planctomycetes bacterium]|nr:hypothetical protein [Planctomycetota bacterium]